MIAGIALTRVDRVRRRWAHVVVATIALAALAVPVAAADSLSAEHADPRAALTVTASGPAELAGLLPGDLLPARTLQIAARGELRYAVRAETSGSSALAGAIMITITLADTGQVLYRGPLTDASVGDGVPARGRTLRDATDRLVITGELPLAAGNAVQGARLSVTWRVTALDPVAVTAPESR